jgi:hypothetical protein
VPTEPGGQPLNVRQRQAAPLRSGENAYSWLTRANGEDIHIMRLREFES